MVLGGHYIITDWLSIIGCTKLALLIRHMHCVVRMTMQQVFWKFQSARDFLGMVLG
jgi:hypothetical protein